MSYNTIADTRTLTHDEWLALRRTGIGGSDAGAIMGVSPYKGAFSVWADKMGKLPPLEDNEALRRGQRPQGAARVQHASQRGAPVHAGRH